MTGPSGCPCYQGVMEVTVLRALVCPTVWPSLNAGLPDVAVRPQQLISPDGTRLCVGGWGHEMQFEACLISDLKVELLTRLFAALPELFTAATCVSEAHLFLEQTAERRLKGYNRPAFHDLLLTSMDRDWKEDPLQEGAPPFHH